MGKHLLIETAEGKKGARPPVWMMRQAGRILPAYNRLRERVGDFRKMVRSPAIAAEVTLMPLQELEVDAVIIFSDILVLPEAMGVPYHIREKEGPILEKRIESTGDIDTLRSEGIEEHLAYVMEAICGVKHQLNGKVPLIGFAGAPWTIFAYLLEGKGSKTFSRAKSFLYREPEASGRLLDKITAATADYLNAQVRAGADIIQIFDSWAGVLGPEAFNRFSLPYIRKILDRVQGVPSIVFARGVYESLPGIAETPCRVVGLDWTISPAEAIRATGGSRTLQGNLDPCLLYAAPEVIRRETLSMLDSFSPVCHIANLGHGVYPDTPLDHVKCFVDTVRNYKYPQP